jgi:hypothetical protein
MDMDKRQRRFTACGVTLQIHSGLLRSGKVPRRIADLMAWHRRVRDHLMILPIST